MPWIRASDDRSWAITSEDQTAFSSAVSWSTFLTLTGEARWLEAHDASLLLEAARTYRPAVDPVPQEHGGALTCDPNPHISFGFGTHFCLGASFARLTLRVVLEELTSRLTRLAPAGAPEYEANIFVKAVKRFDLAYDRR